MIEPVKQNRPWDYEECGFDCGRGGFSVHKGGIDLGTIAMCANEDDAKRVASALNLECLVVEGLLND